jgi:hypothetical protein
MLTDNNPISRGYHDQKFADSVKPGLALKSVLFCSKARRFKRGSVDTWCPAAAQSTYSSNGDLGAVRR